MHKFYRSIARFCSLIMCVGLANSAHAAELNLGEFTLEIPAAYQGPVIKQPMDRITQHRYTVPGAAPQPTISATVIKHPSPPPPVIGPPELLDISRTHLEKMLGAGARQYSDFSAGEPREIKIAGHPAVEVTWSGKAQDVATNAKLFTLTTRQATYLLQVTGPGESNAEVQAAINAFLALRPNR